MEYNITSTKLKEEVVKYLEADTLSTINFVIPLNTLNNIDFNVEIIKNAVLSANSLEIIPIHSLNSKKHKLKCPLMCQVRFTENLYVAELIELNLIASGVDRTDALDELKINILELFEEMEQIDAKNLGKEPKKWKVLLEDLIEKR
ncbi:hypothetical protein L6255_02270 [Candidatus Parcubacteria bacterium]|nr:hypothetical protein [Patescibacteria group bacterium]MCG2689242.1 hypothetical protein [Candidatus Parcubacteria bacterium]